MRDIQNKLVLKHLLSGKSITALQALKKFGIIALHSRASNIRKLIEPYGLDSPMIEVRTRYGKTRVCNYSIPKKDIVKVRQLDKVKQLIAA